MPLELSAVRPAPVQKIISEPGSKKMIHGFQAGAASEWNSETELVKARSYGAGIWTFETTFE